MAVFVRKGYLKFPWFLSTFLLGGMHVSNVCENIFKQTEIIVYWGYSIISLLKRRHEFADIV